MSNTTVIDAIASISAFESAKRTLQIIIKAKKKRGMDYSSELLSVRSMRYDGATLVSAIQLTGWQEHAMSDDGSCAGSYTTRTSITINIAPQTLEDAQRLIQPQFLLDSWHGEEGFSYPDYNAPDFDFDRDDVGTDVDGVLLLDNLGEVVAEAEVNCRPRAYEGGIRWVEVHQSKNEADIAVMLKQADECDSKASEEARWDNFDSAKSLRARAGGIRRQISIAQNVLRLAA